MGDRRYILDPSNDKSCGLQRADGCLAPAARPPNVDLNLAQPVLHPPPCCLLRSHLCCIRGSLARPLESHRPRTPPGNGITCGIGKGNDSIVKGRLNVGLPFGNGLPFPPLNPCRSLFTCHASPLLPSHSAATSCHCPAGTPLGAGIGSSALTAKGQSAAMPDAAVAANLDQPLDV